MKTPLTLLFFLFTLNANGFIVDSLDYGRFGKLKVYHSNTTPKQIVLFVSGDGGWNKGVIDIAGNFLAMDAAVVGIDIRTYFKNLQKTKSECFYPASDFENLSKFIQKRYHYRNYLTPILAGYSSGATLIYGILAQSPANTFSGAIAFGFCPDLQISRPLCSGSGLKIHPLDQEKGFFLEVSKNLQEPFLVFQGKQDEVCDFKTTATFFKQIPNARLITLEKVGHGFSVKQNWVPQLMSAYKEFLVKTENEHKPENDLKLEAETKDLPVHIIPSASASDKPMVFFISGDGGYTSFDKSFCQELASKGMSVVALDALKYFWNEKTPESTTADVEKLIGLYKDRWKKEKIVLIGYSFGADVIPFVFNKMNKSMQDQIQSLVLMSPATDGDFEIHISDMLSLGSAQKKYDVVSEIDKVTNVKLLCIYGSEEDAEIKAKTKNAGLSFLTIKGGHHYDNAFRQLVEAIVAHSTK
ncbi:hypothetical protein L0657_09645 [Dyadobacter sp. CY345]|uniref:AcvB/VirJ family lysyl-phosphatidylglycerol hydrolase n=1 Tax=Dyadobacter sp. CY345 TaxID=2909335 RepID=UPI001F446C1F|nr:AcvB/VirJ family lysyl-phosphatidylglycerol hydrolase [Dyadobacter sp. CY345]MCF2444220.1 hypothetical protein [Dyadobacter sp. CY345]